MPRHPRPQHPTWSAGEGPLARALARPLQAFLRVEAAGGIVLLAATVLAVAWASSPWDASYHQLFDTHLSVSLGHRTASADLRHWIDDGAMVLFFFVIGLEIKQELVDGRLADRRAALAPVAGAIGGMALPALIYVAVNAGGGEPRGWAIPMATDVAFALGVLALLGDRVPRDLTALLLGLAIVDDIGAVAVIAIFYSDDLQLGWLAVAVAGLVLIAGLQRARVWWMPAYVLLGAGVWAATLASGVHATLAGVALGLLAPARPLLRRERVRALGHDLAADDPAEPLDEEALRAARFTLRESTSVAATLEHALHPWAALLVVPLFALANAGVRLSASDLRDAATSRVGLGVALGLVVGKGVGIYAATRLAVRLRIASLPDRVGSRELAGMAAIAGIGFTVSLFVTQLAFDHPVDARRATLAILGASVVAAGLGAALLAAGGRGRRQVTPSP